MKTQERYLPEYKVVTDQALQEVIGQALGMASVCWAPMNGTGMFQSEIVEKILGEVIATVQQYTNERTELHHDDQTMVKVHRALMSAGLTQFGANSAITIMQNNGILFRELKPSEPLPEREPETPLHQHHMGE
jgi:hypothetical protein